MASSDPTPSVICFGAFELDAASGELRKAGISLKIHPQPFRVLTLLVERPGQIVTREQIQHCLWGDNTFVDYERGINFCVNQIRGTLGDDADTPRYIETLPRRGYRFIAAVAPSGSAKPTVSDRTLGILAIKEESLNAGAAIGSAFPSDRDIHVLPSPLPTGDLAARRKWGLGTLIIALPVLAILIAAGVFYFHGKPKVVQKDTVVLADFTNSTSDPVFDGTLRQGLAAQLEQSPYLHIISDEQIQLTLRLMNQPSDARLTPQIALQVCRRTGSTALLQGSIASIGSQYVLGLQVVNCANGESIAEEQVTAQGKGQVLGALASATTKARTKLGESRDTLERFNTPIEQVTTPSLAALQAYSLGRARIRNDEDLAAVPFLQHAIQLDPNFAMAYASLGLIYFGTGDENSGLDNMLKAYDLRSRVSERERLYIASHYYDIVLVDLEKARQSYELWEQIYPRDEIPHLNLGASVYYWLGQYEKGLGELRVQLQLNPTKKAALAQLVNEFTALNRFGEAQSAAQQAFAKYPDYPPLRFSLYELAFVQNDPEGMKRQVLWSKGSPMAEAWMLELEANTAAYFGRLTQAREFSRHAIASAGRGNTKDTAADYKSTQAFREALVGNLSESSKQASEGLKLSGNRYVPLRNAMTLVRAHETLRALAAADKLAAQFPDDTVVQLGWLPMIRAQAALNGNDPARAIEILQRSTPFELGTSRPETFIPTLFPVYLRGEAFLAAKRGSEAAAEFQKILDHRGIVKNDMVGALAQLQLGRAYAMQANLVKARAAYQDFFALWRDADPDIPILVAANAEYAKLK
jgi:DNA-binding winged helix-turn-helix (wHTH) protein/tetratricopeptide (TPR) repeat protein